jgi:hypothetical protein
LISERKHWEIVDLHVAPLMKGWGFAQGKRGWFYALAGGCTKRLVCSFDKRRGEDAGSLHVTVCVGFKDLEDFLSNCTELGLHVNFKLDKRACTMASNLGHLAEPFRYLCWEIAPDSDVTAMAKDICFRISRDGLKYFADYGNLESAVSAWRKGDRHNLGNMAVLYLAAYEWLHGSRERALFDMRDAVISAELPSTRHIYACLLNHLESLTESSEPA